MLLASVWNILQQLVSFVRVEQCVRTSTISYIASWLKRFGAIDVVIFARVGTILDDDDGDDPFSDFCEAINRHKHIRGCLRYATCHILGLAFNLRYQNPSVIHWKELPIRFGAIDVVIFARVGTILDDDGGGGDDPFSDFCEAINRHKHIRGCLRLFKLQCQLEHIN